MTQRIFGPEGLDGEFRWWHEFGEEYRAGEDSGLRGSVAFLMTGGRYAVGAWIWIGEIAWALGVDRDAAREAANGLWRAGYLDRRVNEGTHAFALTHAAVVERNRVMCHLWPIPSRHHRHFTREEAIAKRWYVGCDPSVYEAPCCPIRPDSPEGAKWAAAGKPLLPEGGR